MENNVDKEIVEELTGINEDNEKFLLDFANQQKKYAQMLLSEMGKDMEDVLSGKVKVELTKDEQRKYKKRKWLSKIKNFFEQWS